jgi:hypothetical protein
LDKSHSRMWCRYQCCRSPALFTCQCHEVPPKGELRCSFVVSPLLLLRCYWPLEASHQD